MTARLNVALVSEPLETGVGRLVTQLAIGLAARGHRVMLMHGWRRMEQSFAERIDQSAGTLRIPIDLRRAPNPGDLRAMLAIRCALHRHGPFDLVHAHSSKAGALARLATPRGIGICYTPHALYTLSPLLSPMARCFYAFLERLLARRMDAMLCSSEGERRHAVDLGIAQDRLAVVMNGIDAASDASPPMPRPFPEGALVAGFIGRLEPQKAPHLFLAALARARAAGAPWHGLVIGDGALRGTLEATAEAEGLEQVVRFVGARPVEELLPWCDAIVLTSLYEGFSLIPLEAMRAGLPTLMSDVPGAAEAIISGETGYIVPIGDVDGFARYLVALARDAGLRARLGAAARRRSSLFTSDRLVEDTLAVYARVLAARRCGPLPIEGVPAP